MSTLKNRTIAMNLVHQFCIATAREAQQLFPVGDHSMYKVDGSLTKKVDEKLKALFVSVGTAKLHRIVVDSSYNSVSYKVCACYDRVDSNGKYESTGYYEITVYLVTKQVSEGAGKFTLNKPCDLKHILDLSTQWTEKRLQSNIDKIRALDEKIRQLSSEKSQLEYWVK